MTQKASGSKHIGWWCVLLLTSACLVVYVKDLNRRLLIKNQSLKKESLHLTARWGKLLLEQSAWSTQSRVQKVAHEQLSMDVPTTVKTLVVSTKKQNQKA